MSLGSRVRTWFKAVGRGEELRRQVAEELEFHVASYAEDLVRDGMAPKEALRRARVELGSGARVQEECNRASGGEMVRSFLGDVRHAARTLRRSPGFALTAILTLALGIGAVTSVFSAVNGVLLKPFAFREPGRLVVMRETDSGIRDDREADPVNYRHYLRLQHDSRTLEDATIFQQRGESVSQNGDRPQIVGAVSVSPNYLHVLGVQPLLGRDFAASDAAKGANPVVVLSYGGWQTFFAGDAGVVGKTLRLGGEPATVIGVLPAGTRFPQIALAPKLAQGPQREIMLFLALTPSNWDLSNDTGNFNYSVIARLRRGATVKEARAELETLQRGYAATAKLPVQLGIVLTPLKEDVAAGISGALWLLFAAVTAVLLIACVNLANLQLARAVRAERETAIRSALGAGRGQLMMARLAESLVLAAVGGAAGVGLAFAGVRFLVALAPATVPRLNEVTVSWPVLAFAAGLSVLAAVGFGILPALRGLKTAPQTALQANSTRTANKQEGRRTRSVLVAGQIACTVALLVVTGLALKSFARLVGQQRGFDASHVTLAEVDLYSPQYDDKKPTMKAAKRAFADRVIADLGRLPGVQSVALTSAMPLGGETWIDLLERPDHPVPDAQRPAINVRWVNENFLSTMQMPLVAGRSLTAADRANPYVALISERTAREGFAGENPLGKTLGNLVPNDEHALTVVGVVADTRINGLKDSAAMVYVPYWAFMPWGVTFMVRSTQPSAALMPEVRRTIWGVDTQVAIPVVKPMEEQVSDSVATDRFEALLLTGFGMAGLGLALLGVYGVLAYSVSLRQQEFGIRIALGSGKAALMGLVLRQAAVPVLAGTGVGLVLALVSVRWMRSLLYQTGMLDPAAIGGSVLLLLAASASAALLPARRAAAVEPMTALRNE